MNCKRFVKIAAALLAAMTICASAFSFDFGGSVSDSSSFKGNKFSSLKFDQINDLTLWFKTPITKDGKIYFVAEGLYEFEYDGSVEKAFNRLDLDLLKVAGTISLGQNYLNFSAGRFIYSDLTGLIFSQNGDGAYASFDASRVSVSAYAAYTGLLNANFAKMLNHPNDPFSFDRDLVYDLAQKYIVTSATFALPRLAKSHNLAAQFFGAFKVEGNSYNRMFLTASIDGPIYKTLYYKAFSSFELHAYDGGSMDFSNMSSAKVTWFLPFKSATLDLGVLYASGNNGPFDPFRAVTKIDVSNSLAEPQHSGVIKNSFAASIKPLQSLLVYAGCDLLIDASTSSLGYKGFQYRLGADWQIFSDLRAGASFLQYFDNDNSDFDKVQIALNASITF